MSELFNEAATPCPQRVRSSGLSSRNSDEYNSFDSLWEQSLGSCDDTKYIDFTTEIRAPILTGAKPRRRNKTSTSFAIHNDSEEKATAEQNKEPQAAVKTTNRKTSLLSQPAQRFRPRVSFAPSPPRHAQPKEGFGSQNQAQKTRLERNNELLMQINGNGDESRSKDRRNINVRPSTVFIPPDNTAVANTFMGIFSPLKSDNARRYLNNRKLRSPEHDAKKEDRVRQPSASPRRDPLKPSSKIAQDSYNKRDIVGKNGGKENIPPGMALVNIGGDKNPPLLKSSRALDAKVDISKSTITQTRGVTATASIVTRPLAKKTVNEALRKSSINRPAARTSSLKALKATLDSKPRALSIRNQALSNTSKSSGAELKSSTLSQNSLNNLDIEYPLISENITNAALYDDNWLSHQEVVLTQLINELYVRANRNVTVGDSTLLRHELLMLYQSAPITHLYNRIQASLLYGSLSIPKDILSKKTRLRQDLGMKKKFVDFWIQTYDARALRAALETVVGRKIPSIRGKKDGASTNGIALGSEKSRKRQLAIFLEAFLVQNQDLGQDASEIHGKDFESQGSAYRRTVLRSIMMVILLDKAKTSPQNTLSNSLFLTSSPYKSSTAAMQGLARFLIPSCGDIVKALGQLDCQLRYEQPPLVEYDHEIKNLAVDMRDGVRLTRIVELLLYPQAACSVEVAHGMGLSGADISSQGFQWPLSQHLKLPCLSRAVKLFNVKIALDALNSTKDAMAFVKDLRAGDIVDGHREKTIALLWGLVSIWGLSGLIDLDEVRKEIGRLRKKLISQPGYESTYDKHEFLDHTKMETDKTHEPTELLKDWAFLIARLKGLQLENLSTSFSDGKAYESIVDEYEGYILGSNSDLQPDAGKRPLACRLENLGCNPQFVNLLCSSTSKATIVNSNTTVGILAFLCSRLFSATKYVRAATVLQFAWRRVLVRRDARRRAIARNIARQCAAVVQTRDKILWAKTVIVQWWREMKARQRQKKRAMGRKFSKVPRQRYR